MFLIDWKSSLITFGVIFALYLIVVYRKPGIYKKIDYTNNYKSLMQFIYIDVNWGSSTQALTYKNALTATYRLQTIDDHVKNYRPQVMY